MTTLIAIAALLALAALSLAAAFTTDRKVGGIRFFRLGALRFSFCISRKG